MQFRTRYAIVQSEANVADLRLGKPRPWVHFSFRRRSASLSNHIGHIVFLSAEEKMPWVHTIFHVARMTDIHTVRDFADHHRIDKSVNPEPTPTTITATCCAQPKPAPARVPHNFYGIPKIAIATNSTLIVFHAPFVSIAAVNVSRHLAMLSHLLQGCTLTTSCRHPQRHTCTFQGRASLAFRRSFADTYSH